MAPKALQSATLKGNASATALKAAAAATLTDAGGYLNSNATMKLSSGLANKTMLPNKNVTMLKSIDTIWDEEPDDQKMYEQRKKLKSLAGRVDRMAGVFEEETRARQEQRTLMDELHDEQMKRIDEIGEELDQAMAELAAYIVEFMRRFRKELHDTFSALFSELQEQVELLKPRLAALEARGRVLQDGIEEERKERQRQYAQILDPVKVQIEKLEQGLIREQQIRQTRAAFIQQSMEQAVEALEQSVDTEFAARRQRQTFCEEEWTREADRLEKRHDVVVGSCEKCLEGLEEDANQEHDARINHQDPVVEVLTKFLNDFHADVEEKALQG
ncbi:unnamed protein product [Symbiodinium pilosum]|uniref:SF-assemblin n=1 Tax=Symbiodinium pilosum TaxID=2952 RepID=A0A812RCV1_SYMPI|nr:unnamed protein product [Symbiodinium pilosum]